MISASLDYYRGLRDAMTEAAFFSIYGNLKGLQQAQASAVQEHATGASVDPLELPVVRDALAAIGDGGYVEALARAAFLLSSKGKPLPLSRLELRQELVSDYAHLLPGLAPHEWRRIRGEQEIISRYEPDLAVQTLPQLLESQADREKFVALLDKLIADERVQATSPTEEQTAMLARIREVLAEKPVKPEKREKVERLARPEKVRRPGAA